MKRGGGRKKIKISSFFFPAPEREAILFDSLGWLAGFRRALCSREKKNATTENGRWGCAFVPVCAADGNWGSTPGLTSEFRNMSFSIIAFDELHIDFKNPIDQGNPARA
ncbi:hypothetical protein E2320_013972, partial [Naja naja]